MKIAGKIVGLFIVVFASLIINKLLGYEGDGVLVGVIVATGTYIIVMNR